MHTLFAIKDDSANQVVSMYFIAQSEIEAIRQFKGFLQSGKYPAFPKELTLYEVAQILDDGSLFQQVDWVESFADSSDEDGGIFTKLKMIPLCSGDRIEEAYIEFSRMTKEDFDKLKVTKNVSEAEFDEEMKNGDFGK